MLVYCPFLVVFTFYSFPLTLAEAQEAADSAEAAADEATEAVAATEEAAAVGEAAAADATAAAADATAVGLDIAAAAELGFNPIAGKYDVSKKSAVGIAKTHTHVI